MTVSKSDNSDDILDNIADDPSTEDGDEASSSSRTPSPPPTNEAALLRLADFVKKVSRPKNNLQIAESLRAQKIVSIYESKLEGELLQQKGLQLNKAA